MISYQIAAKEKHSLSKRITRVLSFHFCDLLFAVPFCCRPAACLRSTRKGLLLSPLLLHSVVEISFCLRPKLYFYVVVGQAECTMQLPEEIWPMCNPLKVGFPCIPKKNDQESKRRTLTWQKMKKTGNQKEERWFVVERLNMSCLMSHNQLASGKLTFFLRQIFVLLQSRGSKFDKWIYDFQYIFCLFVCFFNFVVIQ